MKKFLTIFFILVLTLSMAVGCTKDTSTDDTDTPPDNTQANEEEPKDETPPKEEGIAKIGLGTAATQIGKSKDTSDDNGPLAQVDTTFAAVGFDKDDKVVSVTINHAQTKIQHNKDFELDGQVDTRTKVES